MGQALAPLVGRLAQRQAEESVTAAAADAGVPKNPDAAWWLKLLARGVGVIGAGGWLGFFCDFILLTAVVNCVFASDKQIFWWPAVWTRDVRVRTSLVQTTADGRRCNLVRSCERLDTDASSTVINRAHSFPRAAEFRAEPRNFHVSAEFHGILRKHGNSAATAKFCKSV